jgi:peptidylprolyl isomerase
MRRLASPFLIAALVLIGGTGFIGSAASASTVALPSVTGGFNQIPKITFPKKTPPSTLQVSYLHRGNGAKVVAGELLVANYLGQIWGGKVFDSSFSRKQLSGFPIGVGQVIPGWDKGLVGVPIGSRVLLVVPPIDGYGTTGNSSAGITGTDTLVFVVDVVDAYGKSALAQANPVVLHMKEGGVSVAAKGNTQPTITIAKKTAVPTSIGFYELAAGTGPRITAGLVVLQLVQDSWTGSVVASTWKLGSPFGANIGVKGTSSIFDGLVGLNVGSRVLLDLPEIPATSTAAASGPFAVVAEVVLEPHDGAV